jgi:Protein of unknown function, DUF481
VKNFYFLSLFTLISWGCLAQKPTEAVKDTKPKIPPQTMLFRAGLNGDYQTGNVDRVLIKAQTGLEYEHPNSIVGFNTSPRFAYGTINNGLKEKELFVDLNMTFYAYQRKLYYLIFGIAETSNLRKINSRFLGGVSLGYRFIGDKNNPKSRVKLAVTNALLYETTDYYTKSDVNVVRNSTRIKFSAEIIKGVLFFNNSTFLQPAINKPNFRWNALTTLSIRASQNFAFNVLLDNSYESVVPEGTKSTDITFSFGINYNNQLWFKRPVRPERWWMTK